MKGRSFQVSVGSAKSSSHNIPFGVPQGAILSLTLYNIFTSDVLSSNFCGTATFADDTANFASGQTPLLVQNLENLTSRNKQTELSKCFSYYTLPNCNCNLYEEPEVFPNYHFGHQGSL
jgi:Reverse transcriptase (RNA-dependent DNA polymerase)